MTRDELIELLSDVTSLLGTALAREVELKESLASDAADSQRAKLDALKAKLAGERLKLQKLNAASKRRRELEKKRQENQRQTARSAANESKTLQRRVQLLNGQGRVIGWLHNESNGKVTVYDAKGRLVARELNCITLDRTGRFVGRGRQGLVALGRTLEEIRSPVPAGSRQSRRDTRE